MSTTPIVDEALVREVVDRVLAELGQARKRPGVLVLFSGALLGFEDALGALGRLVADGWQLDWRQTPSAERILDQDAIARVGMTHAGPELVRSHDVLIVPTLTANLAAKVAHGIGDCVASNLMAEFIMTGKKVVASVAGACPDAPEKRAWFPDMPEGYAAMLRENLARLESFGVHLTTAARLDQALTKQSAAETSILDCALSLVTEGTLAGVLDGSTLHLQPRALVTALAQDAARERGIRLIRTERN